MQSGKIGHFDVRFVKERIFMKTLKDLGDLKGKRVLVRADFNVPLDATTITDDGRIKAALPTIKTLREEGAKVILMAHLGRPKGKVVPELSLAPVAARLGELLGANVPLAKDTYGENDIIWYTEQGGRRPHAAAAYLVLYGDPNARLNVPANYSLAQRADEITVDDIFGEVLDRAA